MLRGESEWLRTSETAVAWHSLSAVALLFQASSLWPAMAPSTRKSTLFSRFFKELFARSGPERQKERPRSTCTRKRGRESELLLAEGQGVGLAAIDEDVITLDKGALKNLQGQRIFDMALDRPL